MNPEPCMHFGMCTQALRIHFIPSRKPSIELTQAATNHIKELDIKHATGALSVEEKSGK